MTSRERVICSLNHKEPDRVPVDLGSTAVSGMHVSTVYLLRQKLGLDAPGTHVKVVEPSQMLGEIAPDLQDALGVDAVGLSAPVNIFGFENRDWKPWVMFDGTPVLVPGLFNTQPGGNGDILMYPEGDASAPPCARMPHGGHAFETLTRIAGGSDSSDVQDNLQEFGPISEGHLEYLRREADRLYTQTDKAIVGSFGGTSFGDLALVPAPSLKYPRGIRDVAEWYMSTITRRDYIMSVFECQCEIALANLKKIYNAVGNKLSAVFVTGTDFGSQRGPLISVEAYRQIYRPFHELVNEWIHRNTKWKTMIHSCGSVAAFIPDFIDAGFDILNPVQCTAADMDAGWLKEQYGERLTFWGGGVDTQQTLPFGAPREVAAQARARASIFGRGGGYVFNATNNIMAGTPAENVAAMFEAALQVC